MAKSSRKRRQSVGYSGMTERVPGVARKHESIPNGNTPGREWDSERQPMSNGQQGGGLVLNATEDDAERKNTKAYDPGAERHRGVTGRR